MYPTMLYSETHRKGKVFTDQAEHDKALKEGFTTAPWTVGEKAVEKKSEPVEDKKQAWAMADEPKAVYRQNEKRKPGRPKGK